MEKRKIYCLFCLALLFFVSLSCEEYEDETGQDLEEELDPYISGGTRTDGYPSVGTLTNGGSLCTATLIGPRTVLTAAHCIKASSGKFNAKGKTYSWSKAVKHPNYKSNTLANDVAVVTLNSEPSGITPSPINTSPVSRGQKITLVGHGWSTDNGGNAAHKKYVGTNSISSVTQMRIEYAGVSGLCNGDSGGPSFIGNKVVGVHSYRVGGKRCAQKKSGDTRVDTYASWIKSQGDVSAGGGDDGDGGSCEGKCSPTCQCGWTEIGCKNDNDCQSGMYCKIRPQLGNRCLKKK